MTTMNAPTDRDGMAAALLAALLPEACSCLGCGALVWWDRRSRVLRDVTDRSVRVLRAALGRDEVARQKVGLGDGRVHCCLEGPRSGQGGASCWK